MITMTVSNAGWTRNEIVKGWLDSETQDVAEEAADTEIAYIILNIDKAIACGWTYRDGEFSGPYLGQEKDVVGKILTLMVEAGDFAIECLDEIRANA